MAEKFTQINFVNATILKPDARYIIVLNQEHFSVEDVAKLMQSLKQMGIKNAVALHIPGDPDDAVKIIKQEGK